MDSATIGVISGAIGTVTGTFGLILSIIAYRRANELKTLDLRLELRKAENTVKADSSELLPLLDLARQSRERLTAASGQTGAFQGWLLDFEPDYLQTTELTGVAGRLSGNYSSLSANQLENELVDIHELQEKISRLKQRYQTSLSEDDLHRAEIRAAIANRHPAR